MSETSNTGKFKPEEHLTKLPRKQRQPDGSFKTAYSDYLEVKWRLVWLRQECPGASIATTLVEHDPESGSALFSAQITGTAPGQSGGNFATVSAYGSETKADFQDYIEKAETKAIGRALALLGYGTQFAGEEIDEGANNPVDAPVTHERQYPAGHRLAVQVPDSGGGRIPDRQARYGAPQKVLAESVASQKLEMSLGASAGAKSEVLRKQVRSLFVQAGLKGEEAAKFVGAAFNGKQGADLTPDEILKLRDLLRQKVSSQKAG
ncbi:MAG: hypothetical protein HYX87_03550 [Chloroflexi bacterium]|nr:hypothetical protein [Chloroflexota bacterium]